MKVFDYLRRAAYYKLSYYYQKFQFIIMSFMVAGIVDYFFIYEIFCFFIRFISCFYVRNWSSHYYHFINHYFSRNL